MSDCSREAWQAPRGIAGAVHWQGGTESELHYARFVNGEERKAEYIELDGVRYAPKRTCKIYRISNTRDIRKCSLCGKHMYFSNPFARENLNYCPNCGAKVVDA